VRNKKTVLRVSRKSSDEKNIRKVFFNPRDFNENRPSKSKVKEYSDKLNLVKKEISKAVIGQDMVVSSLLRALIANGHVLVEGVPGIAKTLIIRILSEVSGNDVKRIQFTVDLLPTDIVGLTFYRESGSGGSFEVVKGPIFANFLIADEINRSPPKTQSALLEAMQEKQVTIGRETFKLPNPFFVMATQNPLEQAGVYSLPEAQLDRFLFKLLIGYPKPGEEKLIMDCNIDLNKVEDFNLKKVISPKIIIEMQNVVKQVYLGDKVKDYIIDIVGKTRSKDRSYSKYIEWGVSPRASIGLYIASKAEALMQGRNYVRPQDVKVVAKDILRHRIILSYEAEAEKITPDKIIDKILDETPS